MEDFRRSYFCKSEYECLVLCKGSFCYVNQNENLGPYFISIYVTKYEVQSESSRTVLGGLLVFKEESHNFAH